MKIVDNTITKREKEIILLLASGKTKIETAKELSLSISTIKTNVENIYRKLGVHNKAEMIFYLIKNNILILDKED